ncbi:SRPBCC domain-containing protein [Streptosporangium lutulentum]
MRIDHEFTVGVPIDQAWAVLTDLEGIAPCMPGAQLTGVDCDVYSGKVKVKVGPVVSEYAGTVRFVEKDDTNHRAVIDAKGRDSRGAGNASAVITARLRADGAHTVVTVDTDLKISGKIAQLGSGMIKEVSGKLLGQFAACLEGKLAVGVPATPAADPGSPGVARPDEVRKTPRVPARHSRRRPTPMRHPGKRAKPIRRLGKQTEPMRYPRERARPIRRPGKQPRPGKHPRERATPIRRADASSPRRPTPNRWT